MAFDNRIALLRNERGDIIDTKTFSTGADDWLATYAVEQLARRMDVGYTLTILNRPPLNDADGDEIRADSVRRMASIEAKIDAEKLIEARALVAAADAKNEGTEA